MALGILIVFLELYERLYFSLHMAAKIKELGQYAKKKCFSKVNVDFWGKYY